MGKHTVYTCDRCNQEFDKESYLKTITITQYKDNGYGDNRINNIELCDECKREFNQLIILNFLKAEK